MCFYDLICKIDTKHNLCTICIVFLFCKTQTFIVNILFIYYFVNSFVTQNSVKLPSVIRWIVCTSNRHNKRAPICGMIGLTTKQSSPTKEGALYV